MTRTTHNKKYVGDYGGDVSGAICANARTGGLVRRVKLSIALY